MPKDSTQSIHHFIKSKKEYQSKLTKILKKYFVRYISKSFDKSLREFQKILLKIPEWSDDKLNKEFSKFTKFIENRFDLSEEDLSKTLSILIGLNVKIMAPITYDIEVKIPKFKDFWYKCIKKIGKYYYEHPKVMLSDLEFEKTYPYIEEAINSIILKYIPLQDILSGKREPLDVYNFDELEENLDENSVEIQKSKDNIEVTLESKTASDNDLKYLSSEEFENEYYKSDNEKEDKKEEKSEEKHIKLQKYVFPKKNYKKKIAKNEIDENFFDDM